MAVAVVTGSNKGIGFGVVKGLCKQYTGTVYLTARNEERGLAAVKELEAEGHTPKFHQLDIGDEASVIRLRDFMEEKHGGIDVLVNNAGIQHAALEPFGEQARVTLKTNYWDTKKACEILFPILKPGARVVNVSSAMGYLRRLENATNKEKARENMNILASEDLTVEQLDGLMRNFEMAADAGNHEEDWNNSTYSVSKIGLSALSRIQQMELAKDTSRPDIVLNHVHPGYVDTDMTSHKGHLTIDRGAESAIYAALLPQGTPIRGAYLWHDCQVVDWVNGPLPAAY